MMYEYMELSDQTLITHSQLIEKDGQKTVQVHFERPKAGGFDMAPCELPTYTWIKRDGFTDAEIERFTELLQHNAHLLFRYAENGGILSA